MDKTKPLNSFISPATNGGKPGLSSFVSGAGGGPSATGGKPPLASFAKPKPISSVLSPKPTGPTLTGPDNPVGSLPVIKQLTEFGTGVGTSVIKGGLNLGKAFMKASQGVADLGTKVFGAPKQDYSPVIDNLDKIAKEGYTDPFKKELDTGLGKTGEVVGALAPYLESGGTISKITNKATDAVSGAAELMSPTSKVVPALARIFTGATAEGAQNYILGYALTGGDQKQALTQGLTAGILKGATSSVAEVMKGAKVDEKLMNTIYKSDKREESGILFGSKNKTLAQEALDRGITGNVKQQAVQITEGMSDAETKIADEIEKAGNPMLKLDDPQRYIDAIQNRIDLLKKSGATTEAQGLETSLKSISPEGEIPANSALALRRLLDGLRQSKSFLMPTEELVAQQAGLKEMTDTLRSKINSIGVTGDAMKDYQFFINAKDKLVKYAVSSKNKNTIDFFDRLIFAESVYAHTPVGLGIIGARKAMLFRPATAAQAIKNLGESSPLGAGIRSSIGAMFGKVTKTK